MIVTHDRDVTCDMWPFSYIMVLMSKLVHHVMLYVMLGGGRARTVVPHWHCAEAPLCLAWVLAEHGNMVCHTAPIPDMADTDYNLVVAPVGKEAAQAGTAAVW